MRNRPQARCKIFVTNWRRRFRTTPDSSGLINQTLYKNRYENMTFDR